MIEPVNVEMKSGLTVQVREDENGLLKIIACDDSSIVQSLVTPEDLYSLRNALLTVVDALETQIVG